MTPGAHGEADGVGGAVGLVALVALVARWRTVPAEARRGSAGL